MKNTAYIAILFIICALPTFASEPSHIEVNNAYAFATTSVQKNGAIFLSVTNETDAADRLIEAATDVAARTELHTHTMDDGIMMMREVEGYDLPAHDIVTLEPAGHHIMLMGLNAPLTLGESLPLTLTFENHSPIVVNVDIIAPGTKPTGAELKSTHEHPYP